MFSIERLVDTKIPMDINDIIFGFKPYNGQYQLVMEQVRKSYLKEWFQVFHKLWIELSKRSGVLDITMEVSFEDNSMAQLDILQTDIYSIDREQDIEILRTKVTDLITGLDDDIIYDGLKRMDEDFYEIPELTEIIINYEDYVGDFSLFSLDKSEWKLDYQCICRNRKTYINENSSFEFKITLRNVRYLRYNHYHNYCTC